MSTGTKIPIKDSIAAKMLLVVLGLYLLIATGVTLSYIWMEYRYQKANITQDLGDIESAFVDGLAVSMWGLDQNALKATVEGMLKIPTLVGIKISTDEGTLVAIGGVVTQNGQTGEAGLHVDLSGISENEEAVHNDENYRFDMFERRFPVSYNLDGEDITLGWATIYSNSSVIYRQMKLQVAMLVVTIALTLITFFMALLWAVNRYLRRPLGILTNATAGISLDSLGSFSVDTQVSGRSEIKILEEAMIAMVANLSDAISKREQTEASLRASEKRYRALFEKNNDAIFLVQKETGRYLDANAAAALLTGRSVEELKRLTTLDVAPNGAGERLRIVSASDQTLDFGVVTYQRPDDSRRIARLSTVSLDRETLIGIARDITEEQATERQLRRTKKMDAIGQLTGGIAHDFNNILGIILGNLDLLERQIPDDDKARKRVRTIQKSAQRAADLTRQLLGFSRRQTARMAVTDINRVMGEMESLIAHSVTPQVEIENKLADDLWLTEIDPGDFQDALLNLIFNARDAMAGRGLLTLETRNCTLDADYCALNPGAEPGEYVCLTVSDRGEGIPLEQQERIFEPFFSTKSQGTGLGLSMVYGFVQRSKGNIKVNSEPGIGTCFRLYLPRATGEEQQNRQNAEHSGTEVRGTETLLVVDDEPSLLDLAEESLQALGYRVLTAGNGRQALERLAEEPGIALLFSDVVMPGGINGYELAADATAQRPGLKVLLTSGYINKAVAGSDQARFSANLLSKPYTQAELAQRVRVLLG